MDCDTTVWHTRNLQEAIRRDRQVSHEKHVDQMSTSANTVLICSSRWEVLDIHEREFNKMKQDSPSLCKQIQAVFTSIPDDCSAATAESHEDVDRRRMSTGTGPAHHHAYFLRWTNLAVATDKGYRNCKHYTRPGLTSQCHSVNWVR